MEMPVVFKKGIGIMLAVPITKFSCSISDGVYMSAVNTCQTATPFLDGINMLNNILPALRNNLLTLEDTRLINNLKSILSNLHDIIYHNRALFSSSILQDISDKNKLLAMNFVGYRDYDHYYANINKNQHLINKFLMGTGESFGHESRGTYNFEDTQISLDVLIDNGTNPGGRRNLTQQEFHITRSLFNFFQQNGFPRLYQDNGHEYPNPLFNAEDIKIADTIDIENDRLMHFRIVHYIQCLITAIMFKCINETPEIRREIFTRINSLLDQLTQEAEWTRTSLNNEINSVDFLITKILDGVHLQNEIGDYLSIKNFANAIYPSLDIIQDPNDPSVQQHVTQIEFIKLETHERKIEDGFWTRTGYFCIPLSKYLRKIYPQTRTSMLNWLNSDGAIGTLGEEREILINALYDLTERDVDNICNFLQRIEKFAPQFSLENDIVLESTTLDNITNEYWETALKDLDHMVTEEERRDKTEEQIKNITEDKQNQFIDQLQTDEQTKNILRAGLKLFTNETFPHVSPETIMGFDDEKQINNFCRFIDVITDNQFAVFRAPAISNFINLIINDDSDGTRRQQFNNLIRRLRFTQDFHLSNEQLAEINFGILDNNCIEKILSYHSLNNISSAQIQQLPLINLAPNWQIPILQNRINDLTLDQFNSFDMAHLPSYRDFSSVDCLQLFLTNRFNDLSDIQITQINFQTLPLANQILILERRLSVVTITQVQNINLQELRVHNENIYRTLIEQKFLFLSPTQFSQLDSNGHLPAEARVIYQFFKDQLDYSRYMLNPNENALNPRVINSMPDDFKFPFELLYVAYNVNLIPNDLQNEFRPAVKYVFENPNKVHPEIFMTLLDENIWAEELIAPLVANTNLNDFPRRYLCDLLRKYEPNISAENKNAFDINHLRQLDNSEHRESIFNIWLRLYGNCREKIEQINVANLNLTELEMLINNFVNDPTSGSRCSSSNYLTSAQTNQINVSQLQNQTLFNFLSVVLPKDENYITDAQMSELDCANTDIARLIINNDASAKRLTLNQIRSIDLNNLGQTTSKLISMEIANMTTHRENIINTLSREHIVGPMYCFELLTNEQIAQVEFAWIRQDIQTRFLIKKSNLITEQQVQDINFELDNSFIDINVRCRILKSLNDANKLRFLNENQLNQLNSNISMARNRYQDLVKTFFSMFARFYTHGQLENVTLEQIPNVFLNLNLVNIESGLLNYIVKNQREELSTAKVQQINLPDLKSIILSHLLKTRIKDFTENQIESLMNSQNVNLDDIKNIEIDNLQTLRNNKPKSYHRIFETFYRHFSIKQLMSVAWLTPVVCQGLDPIAEIRTRQHVASHFIVKINAPDNTQARLVALLCDELQALQPNLLENIPAEHRDHFKVALLNSRLLHNQTDFIEANQRENFLGAIQIMFGVPKVYLQSVEYVINNWNNILHAQIQHLEIIDDFSLETRNTILRDYLNDLSAAQLQKINVENLAAEITTNALLERAADFTVEQVRTILNLPNQIDLSDENIPNLQLQQLPSILINYLINKKLDLIRDRVYDLLSNRFRDIKAQQLEQCCIVLSGAQLNNLYAHNQGNFFRLFDQCAIKFTREQITDENLTQNVIRSITITPNNQHVAGVLLSYRIHDISIQQIQALNIVRLPAEARANPDLYIKRNPKIIIRRIRNSDVGPLDLLEEANRYKDLSQNQFDTCLNYKCTSNIIQILKENQEARITDANAKQINLVNVYNDDAIRREPGMFIRLFDACAIYFTQEQLTNQNLTQEAIQRITIRPNNQHVAGILLSYRAASLSENQIQAIDFNDEIVRQITNERVHKDPIAILREARPFRFLTKVQFDNLDYTEPLNVVEILEEDKEDSISPENARRINLGAVFSAIPQRTFFDLFNSNRKNKFTSLFNACAKYFTPEQLTIQNLPQNALWSIKIRPNNQHVAGVLLVHRANDVSAEQIHAMDLTYHGEIHKLINTDPEVILRRAKRYKDLSDEQFNNINTSGGRRIIFYENNGCILAILTQNQTHRINEANAQTINLAKVYDDVLKDRPDRNELFTRLFDGCALKFTEAQIKSLSATAIQSIIIRPDNQHVAGILLLYRIQDITREQIQAMYLCIPSDKNRNNPDLCLKKYAQTITLKEVNKSAIDLLRAANRYKDLSENQFNTMVNFAYTDNIIQILKEDIGQRVARILTLENVHEINILDVYKKIEDDNNLKLRFFNFISDCSDRLSSDQIRSFPARDPYNFMEICLRKNLFDHLSYNQKNNFSSREIAYDCTNDQLYELSNCGNLFARAMLIINYLNAPRDSNYQVTDRQLQIYIDKLQLKRETPELIGSYIVWLQKQYPKKISYSEDEKTFWRRYFWLFKGGFIKHLRKEGCNDNRISAEELQRLVVHKFRTWTHKTYRDERTVKHLDNKLSDLKSFFFNELSSKYRDEIKKIEIGEFEDRNTYQKEIRVDIKPDR